MKKIWLVILTLTIMLCMALCLFACGDNGNKTQNTDSGNGNNTANLVGNNGSSTPSDNNASNDTGSDSGNAVGDGTGDKALEATVGLEFELLDDVRMASRVMMARQNKYL